MTQALRLDACTSPRTPTLQNELNSRRGGILLRLVWVPVLGVKPIAHLLSDTKYHSTKVIYKTRKSPGFGHDHQLGTSRNITIRTLSNSTVSISITSPTPLRYCTDSIYTRYPLRNLIDILPPITPSVYDNTHG